jgi:phosphatidate cytidylyltransferase
VRAVFGERLWSSLVFAPLVAGAFYLGRLYFAALILLVSVFGATEYRRIMSLAGVEIHIAFIPISAAVALAGYLVPSMFVTVLSGGAVLVLSIALIKSGTAPSAMFSLSGVMYVGGLLGSLFLLRAGPQGRTWSFFVLMATWVTDVGAYMGGVALGKHKLAPKISPGKSWEGALCGAVASTLAGGALSGYFGFPVGYGAAAGGFLGVLAELGDLVESSLKRYGNVKDSGHAIPGHGGILDRFDSLLFTGAGGLLLRTLHGLLFR